MSLQIESARPEDGPAALQLVLHGTLPRRSRPAAAGPAALPEDVGGAEVTLAWNWAREDLSGLIVARHRGALVAATWVQPSIPGVWTWWPGRALPTAPAAALPGVRETARRFLAERVPRIIRTLLDADDALGQQQVGLLGLRPMTWIGSMVWPASRPPAAGAEKTLSYRSVTPTQLEEFASLVSRTYAETHDCPQLQGMLSAADLLDLYRQSPTFSSRDWYAVRARESGREVGCLILGRSLAEHQTEIAYLGLVPESRRRGWGLALVREAQGLTVEAGHERLTVAVDESNQPALHCYVRAGFTTYHRQQLFARLGPPSP